MRGCGLCSTERLRACVTGTCRCRLATICEHTHDKHRNERDHRNLQQQAEHAGKTAKAVAEQHADQATDEKTAQHGTTEVTEHTAGTLCLRSILRTCCARTVGLRRAGIRRHRTFHRRGIVRCSARRRWRLISARATAAETATARTASLGEIDRSKRGNQP